MAYDEDLADRVRGCLPDGVEVAERRMFGGLAFLVGGHLAVAVSGQGGLMVRCDPADTEALLAQVGVSRMVMRGRAMDGWLRVAAEHVVPETSLQGWVDVGTVYAGGLPPKPGR